MKLYFKAGACSLSPHIALHEAGLKFESEAVDLMTKLTASGANFREVNPKGQVPTLVLDDGTVLTEGPVIVQYIADQVPAAKLAPAAGSLERYQMMELLNYLTSEIHKSFSPVFYPTTPDAFKAIAIEGLKAKFAYLDSKLAGKQYLMGDQFTVADGYLFTVSNWAPRVGIDLSGLINLMAFRARVAARPAVKATMVAEGLIPA